VREAKPRAAFDLAEVDDDHARLGRLLGGGGAVPVGILVVPLGRLVEREVERLWFPGLPTAGFHWVSHV